MTPDSRAHLVKALILDEGVRNFPYKDTVGKLTIGVGRNLDDRGLSDQEIGVLLENDIAIVVEELDRHLPWWREMNDVRQRVLANMCFNLGWPKLRGFVNTLAAMQRGDYQVAADGMRASLWARQVGARARRLAREMETGTTDLPGTVRA
ncbi:MAG: glycoside hydrolase family protein [Acidobacteria bacterium]|nr:glycoside hydrolase family protein [Acidobacteriota bacterium]